MSGPADGAVVGSGRHRYRRVPEWPCAAAAAPFEHPGAVAVDSKGLVHVLSREAKRPMTVWRTDGTFVRTWGQGAFSAMPHGIAIAPDDTVWVVDRDWHVATRFSPDGTVLQTLGRKLSPSPTCDGRVVKARPFNMPANLVVASDGEIFAADGYGNHKVHRFASDGRVLASWGRQGKGPGEFALVHSVALDGRGRVFVCDDENDRIQIFDRAGRFLDQWAMRNPSGLHIGGDVVYVTELQPFRDDRIGPGRGRVSLWTLDGEPLAAWLGTDAPGGDLMRGAHDLAVDASGDIYVAEGASGRVSKFERLR